MTKRNSVKGRFLPKADGFTLLELLVVVTILSILSLSAVLATGGGMLSNSSAAQSVVTTAQALQFTVAVARDRAIISRQATGILPRENGWAIASAVSEESGWREVSERQGAANVIWRVNGALYSPRDEVHTIPVIRFLADGRSTAFSAQISLREIELECATNGNGPLECNER